MQTHLKSDLIKLSPTPHQTPGPFYPRAENKNSSANLTTLRTSGERLELSGQILSEEGHALAQAFIEIWQANAFGRYLHPDDTNVAAPLDPHFRYHGECTCDPAGNFSFKTIVPGPYPAEDDWLRPPHIHVKVSAKNYATLTTQIYFQGDDLNDVDQVLNRLSSEEKSSLVMPLEKICANGVSIIKGKVQLVLAHPH